MEKNNGTTLYTYMATQLEKRQVKFLKTLAGGPKTAAHVAKLLEWDGETIKSVGQSLIKAGKIKSGPGKTLVLVEEKETKKSSKITPPKGKSHKAAAPDDDDDDDDDDESSADPDEEDPEDLEDVDVTVVKVNAKKNTITVDYEGEQIEMAGDEDDIDVSEFEKGDTVTISAEYDSDDEEWTLSSIAESDDDASEGTDDDDPPEGVEDEDFVIIKVNKKSNSITVEYEGDEIEIGADEDDFDLSEFSKGDTVTLSAEYDADDEEWTLSAIEEIEDPEPVKKGGKKTPAPVVKDKDKKGKKSGPFNIQFQTIDALTDDEIQERIDQSVECAKELQKEFPNVSETLMRTVVRYRKQLKTREED